MASSRYSLLAKRETSSEEDAFSDDETLTSQDLNSIRKGSFSTWARLAVIQVGVLAIWTALLAAVFRALPAHQKGWRDDIAYSPTRGAFKYEKRMVGYNFEETNAFKGQPIEDIDKSWDVLLNNPHDVLITPSQAERANITTIPVMAGPNKGKLLTTSVTYHMLHCLYNIYKYNHKEYFGPDPDGPTWEMQHTDHCIDNLRQFVQCHAGSGLASYKWLDSRKIPWPVLDAEEVCVDWDHYDGWMRENSMPMKEVKGLVSDEGESLLVHPTLGGITLKDYTDGAAALTEAHQHAVAEGKGHTHSPLDGPI